jgi:hypothetical protein
LLSVSVLLGIDSPGVVSEKIPPTPLWPSDDKLHCLFFLACSSVATGPCSLWSLM